MVLGGLHHVDYNLPGAFSYEQFLRTLLTLQLDYPTIEEGYRRAVFNVIARNQDDHVNNLCCKSSFQKLLSVYACRWTEGPEEQAE